jgi:predicted metalloprotease with PDZ domain
MTLSLSSVKAQSQIAFEVSFSEPQAHYADVKMQISGNTQSTVAVKMPVWAPGSYLVREFAKNVEDFNAADGSGKALAFQKTSKNTWEIRAGKADKIVISYRVYAFEISVRTSFIDASHAFLSPTGIFMYPQGKLQQPSTVTIKPFAGWSKVSTGLEPVNGKQHTFYAKDFDILFDSPIEVGNQEIFEFNAAGVRHEVAMYGGGNYDKERLKKDMTRIVEETTAVFGENPNKYYVFIVHNYANGGGGLEHLNSTVLGASRNSYTNEDAYKGFLSLVAHEYFHLWNVKRMRPAALGPFNYDEENYTTNLWISEGFTAYYDNLFVRRAGLYSPEKYLDMLASGMATIDNQPGNKIQTAAEASFDAWIKYYRPNENSRNSSISYYDKGSLIAMLMDLEILNATGGQKGLDDVMKAVYDQYYKKLNRGFTDAEFKVAVEKVAGKSFDQFYADYVNGTKTADYTKYLGYAGYQALDENAQKNDAFLGASFVKRDAKLLVTSVLRNSPAWKFGLNVNDELKTIDGQPAELAPRDAEKFFASNKKVGEQVKLGIVRDGMEQSLDISLSRNPTIKYRIVSVDSPTAEQLTVRKKWLKL